MWNLKSKINEQTKQKQIHRHREHTDDCQRREDRGMGEKGEVIKNYRLVVRK